MNKDSTWCSTWTSSKNLLSFLRKESCLAFKRYRISCDSEQILLCLAFQARFFSSWTSGKVLFSFLSKESCLQYKDKRNLAWSSKTNKNLERTQARTSTSASTWILEKSNKCLSSTAPVNSSTYVLKYLSQYFIKCHLASLHDKYWSSTWPVKYLDFLPSTLYITGTKYLTKYLEPVHALGCALS